MHDVYAFYGGSKNRVYVNKRREGPGSGPAEADHGDFDQILLLDDCIQKINNIAAGILGKFDIIASASGKLWEILKAAILKGPKERLFKMALVNFVGIRCFKIELEQISPLATFL